MQHLDMRAHRVTYGRRCNDGFTTTIALRIHALRIAQDRKTKSKAKRCRWQAIACM